MANSKYGYVRSFEQPDTLLANTWIVVRIDGRGFSKFTAKYKFVKPNDRNALDLMNAAAEAVMKELTDLVLAYGNSDEYSFVFHKDCALFDRRASKLTTTIVSTFTAYYVFLWSKYFPDKPLTPPLPSFDGRAVCYPSDINLRDYMSWRQVDCHINNLYNTTFWTLVQLGGMGAREAEQRLSGTVSSDKNEILFREFGINYNKEPECFKKGTVLYRDFFPTAPAEKSSSPTLAAFPSPPIAHPQPIRAPTSLVSQPVGIAALYLQDQGVPSMSPGPGPTFLSTTSTPSPPPSAHKMSKAELPNPLRSNPVSPDNSTYPSTSSMPLSPPSTVTSSHGNLTSPHSKQIFPSLMPLPLSPLMLKPSTKPPLSLNPPNPTTRTNFSPTSPQSDFPPAFPIAGYSHKRPALVDRPGSHSASASMTVSNPSQTQPSGLKKRSPSQPQLPTYFASETSSPPAGPPAIPLRMSSIPANSKPRKLSLQSHRSLATLKPTKSSFEDQENVVNTAGSITPRKVSPPLDRNKELPSPPMNVGEEMRTRDKVVGSSSRSPSYTTAQDRSASDSDKRGGHIWPNEYASHPGIAELSAGSTRRGSTHSRLHSAPISSSPIYYSPNQTPSSSSSAGPAKSRTYPGANIPAQTDMEIQPTPPLKDSPRSKAAKGKDDPVPKGKQTKQRGNAAKKESEASDGRPVQMSRTQKEKDRKKRSKAKVLIEHVDLIRDEFWEKRPWILSGKTG